MQIRELGKQDRIKVVNWIRSGAPLHKGVSLYQTLPYEPLLLKRLKDHPATYYSQLCEDMCTLLGISKTKFLAIIKQYSNGQNSKKPASANYHPKTHTDEGTSYKRTGDQNEKRDDAPNPRRSFRSNWSFLSKPECPTQLKALAADKITAWENYTKEHPKLFDCSSLEECYSCAHKIVENYKENRLIHLEFEYYQEHKSVLGRHRVFAQYERFRHLQRKNIVELVKLHEKTLPHHIWRIESEIKKGNKPHLQGDREKKLKQVQAELFEVKRLLGLNE